MTLRNFRKPPPGTLVTVAFAGVLLLTGCSRSADTEEASAQEVVFVEEVGIFPFEGISDWVTYANQISVVEIINEKRLRPEVGPESDHIPRLVTARVERNLWSKDGYPAKEVQFIANGWIAKDGKELPIWPSEGLRLLVGGRYVLPLFESSGEWGVLTTSSIIPLKGELVHHDFEPASRAAEALTGISMDALERDINVVLPDPLATQIEPGLTTIQRAVAISELRDGVDGRSDAEEQQIPGRSDADAEEMGELTDEETLEIEGSGG